MIPGTEGPRNIVTIEKAKPESIAGRLMLLCVVLQIIPKVLAEGVFIRDIGVENTGEFWPLLGEFREIEIARLAKSYYENAFAVLRNHAPCVDDLGINLVTKLLGLGVADNFESPPFVVAFEVLYVFKNKRRWAMVVEYFCNLKEQIALLLILEAVLAAKADFLGNASETEWLAGESAAQDVELLNVLLEVYSMDIAMGRFPEVRSISNLAIFVPVA